jgi:signal transduction histidine kinase/CheY-like chemotaxis protein
MPFSKSMRKTNIGFIVATLLIAGISALSYISTRGLIEDSQWVSHTHEVQANLSELSTHLLSAEGYLDEYVETHKGENFEHYSVHHSLILPKLEQVEFLTSDNVVQQERIAELRPLIENKLQQWSTAAARHRSGIKPAEVGDQILDLIQRMNQFEAKLLKIRTEKSNSTTKIALTIIITGGLLAVFILAYAVWRVNRDMKLRTKAQEASRADAERAEKASRVKAEFLANMSHEIRTPLNAILGMTELILDSELSPSQITYARMIQESGAGLLHIIDDLLDFSKMDEGKLELESISFNLRHLVESHVDLFSKRMREKKIGLSVHFDPNVPDLLSGDSSRIAQILLNLLGNAIKFTSVGSITLDIGHERMTRDEVLLKFSVTDTGIGIPSEIQEKLFRPFTQADESMARRFGGTGLGLSICKKLVELMNGSIRVESTEGIGSTFWFTCKVKVQDERSLPIEVAQPNESARHERALSKTTTVLVVEDNLVNQALVLAQLKKLGYATRAVGNGKEALEAVSQDSYDLILMDCQMPEMDGFEATQKIRKLELQRGTHTPIIALTANAMREDQLRCMEVGMNEFLTKPIKIDDLAKALTRWSSAA